MVVEGRFGGGAWRGGLEGEVEVEVEPGSGASGALDWLPRHGGISRLRRYFLDSLALRPATSRPRVEPFTSGSM